MPPKKPSVKKKSSAPKKKVARSPDPFADTEESRAWQAREDVWNSTPSEEIAERLAKALLHEARTTGDDLKVHAANVAVVLWSALREEGRGRFEGPRARGQGGAPARFERDPNVGLLVAVRRLEGSTGQREVIQRTPVRHARRVHRGRARSAEPQLREGGAPRSRDGDDELRRSHVAQPARAEGSMPARTCSGRSPVDHLSNASRSISKSS